MKGPPWGGARRPLFGSRPHRSRGGRGGGTRDGHRTRRFGPRHRVLRAFGSTRSSVSRRAWQDVRKSGPEGGDLPAHPGTLGHPLRDRRSSTRTVPAAQLTLYALLEPVLQLPLPGGRADVDRALEMVEEDRPTRHSSAAPSSWSRCSSSAAATTRAECEQNHEAREATIVGPSLPSGDSIVSEFPSGLERRL